MYEVQHKNNETDAVVLLIYIIRKIIWDNPQSLNTAAYDAATVQSNGADHFLYECLGPPLFLLYIICQHKIGSFKHGFDLWKKKKFHEARTGK